MDLVIRKIYQKIKKYDSIVIARHIGPDPDAIASQISLRDSIKLTFPNKKVFAIGMGVAKFKMYGLLDKAPTDTSKSLLIVLDVPGAARIDGAKIEDYGEVIKIDHHPFENSFGGIEWVDDTASSTCQMVAKLILNSKLQMNKKIAENLFLGIVSDSDRFLLSYTTSETFAIVSELVNKEHLELPVLYSKLYERPLAEVRFHGYLGENMTVTENGLGYLQISADITLKYGVDSATASNMINDFNFIKEVIVWTFITYDERNEIYKVNIRSRGPVINEVAQKYNGGGHKFASGIRINDKEQIPLLIADLDEVCKQYQENQKHE